tara:strand:+ start:38 stop:601 length:564 start_codon:yes stop_codon:yes gene_type:complete
MKKRIILLISGKGTNAINIINYFKNSDLIEVSLVLSNNKNSPIFKTIKKYNVSAESFNIEDFNYQVFEKIKKINPDLIVLAGFLKKISSKFIDFFSKKIINIHPSLLPKYGGKGMYGAHIHKKVIDSNDKETGITIHFVSNEYDSGEIIFQKKMMIDKNDDASLIEKKVHNLEYEYYPKIIESLLES